MKTNHEEVPMLELCQEHSDELNSKVLCDDTDVFVCGLMLISTRI